MTTDEGSWFLATEQGLLPAARARQASFELIRPGRLVPSEPADTVCSVAAAGGAIVGSFSPMPAG